MVLSQKQNKSMKCSPVRLVALCRGNSTNMAAGVQLARRHAGILQASAVVAMNEKHYESDFYDESNVSVM